MNESRGDSALKEPALTPLIYCCDFHYSVIQAPGHISADKRTCPQSNGLVKINIKASSMSLNTTENFFRPHACSKGGRYINGVEAESQFHRKFSTALMGYIVKCM